MRENYFSNLFLHGFVAIKEKMPGPNEYLHLLGFECGSCVNASTCSPVMYSGSFCRHHFVVVVDGPVFSENGEEYCLGYRRNRHGSPSLR